MHRRGEAAVVGGGLAGLWVSYELLRRGYRVTLYESHEIGYGASSRAAGIISLQLPRSLLPYAIEGIKSYAELGVERMADTLWIPRASEFHCAARIADELRSRGLYAEAAEIDDVKVKFRVTGNGERVILMKQGVANPSDAISSLMKRLGDMGGLNVVSGPVYVKDGKLYYNGSPVDHDLKFIAAGPWSASLLPSVSGKLKTYRCSAHSVRGDGWVPKFILEDDRGGFYVTPESDSQVIIGGGDAPLVSPDDGFAVSKYEAYDVLEAVASRMPEANAYYPVSSWAAPCVSAMDGMPVVGELDGVYVITGLNGAGLTLSPGLSALVVDIAEGVAEEPEALSPRRLLRENLKGPEEPFDRICDP